MARTLSAFLLRSAPGYMAAVVVVVLAGTVYASTLAPTISWRNGGADGAELAAAVLSHGVPHPPGYPTYLLIAQGWLLLPFQGDPAHRLTMLSAAGMSIVGGLIAFLVAQQGRYVGQNKGVAFGAVGGALGFTLMPLVWSQATITEVYGVGLALFALATVATLAWYSRPQPWRLVLAIALHGVGIGALPQTALLLPGIAWLWYRQKQGRPNPYVLGVVFCLSLGIFALLPLRAIAAPAINWGDVVTLDAWQAHVFATSYHSFIIPAGSAEWWNQLVQAQSVMGKNMGVMGIIAALLGIGVLTKTDIALSGYWLSLILFSLLFFATYPVERGDVYLLPALYSSAVVGGVGLSTLGHKLYSYKGAVALGLGTILLVAGLYSGYQESVTRVSAQGDAAAWHYATTTLTAAPYGAIVVSTADECTFPLWYAQSLGMREDVVVLDNRLLAYSWYQTQVARRYPTLDRRALRPGGLSALKRPVIEVSFSETPVSCL